jgi:hypothetical protein
VFKVGPATSIWQLLIGSTMKEGPPPSCCCEDWALFDGRRGGALVPNDVMTAHCMPVNGVSSATTVTVASAAKAGGTARAGSSRGNSYV